MARQKSVCSGLDNLRKKSGTTAGGRPVGDAIARGELMLFDDNTDNLRPNRTAKQIVRLKGDKNIPAATGNK